MERTPWKLPQATYNVEVTYFNVHHGSCLVERTPWKLPLGT